jgi:hypothetical protein
MHLPLGDGPCSVNALRNVAVRPAHRLLMRLRLPRLYGSWPTRGEGTSIVASLHALCVARVLVDDKAAGRLCNSAISDELFGVCPCLADEPYGVARPCFAFLR